MAAGLPELHSVAMRSTFSETFSNQLIRAGLRYPLNILPTPVRRKGTPYQSAMSMLNFYINRAGKNLSQKQKRVLERAKGELRDAFRRD